METIKRDKGKINALCGEVNSPIAGFFHQEDHSHPVYFSCFTRRRNQGVLAEDRVKGNALHLFHRQVLREAY